MFIYESGAGRVQAEQRCLGMGTVPAPDGSPCPTEFMTSVNWTLVLQMENWSTCDWVTSRNWQRKLVKDWTQWLSSKEFRASDRVARALRSRSPSKTSCLPPEGSVFDPEQLLFGKSPNYEVPEQQLQPQSLGVCVTGTQEGRAADGPVLSVCRSCAGTTSRRPARRQQCRTGKGKPCVVSHSPQLLQLLQSLYG